MMATTAILPPTIHYTSISAEESNRLLQEALSVIRSNANQMTKLLDTGKTLDALKHVSNILMELRSGSIPPKGYYELYMAAFDQLRFLSGNLLDSTGDDKFNLNDLYEIVQYSGNILPRLYLMASIGAIYIRHKKTEKKENNSLDDPSVIDILRDILEMSRGVQHPLRGLFLRYYLNSIIKDFSPENSDDLMHLVDFLLVNFIEMNKLWVRLQYQGHSKDRERREKERKELKIIVGSSLVRLSQLDGLDAEQYKSKVLPRLLQQIISCKDTIAQEYLMEVITQVFPDAFHLCTLEMFLESVILLEDGVNVKSIINAMMDRLANYALNVSGTADSTPSISNEINLFQLFWTKIKELINTRKAMDLSDSLSLLVSVLNLTLCLYPLNISNADAVFKYSCDLLMPFSKDLDVINSNSSKYLLRLLRMPIDVFKKDITWILELENYQNSMSFLSYRNRKTLSVALIEHLIVSERTISTGPELKMFVRLVSSLIKDQEDQPIQYSSSSNESSPLGSPKLNINDLNTFIDEQQTLAKMVHHLSNDSPEKLFELIALCFKYLSDGGSLRMRFTIPALVTRALELVRKVKFFHTSEYNNDNTFTTGIFKFVYNMLYILVSKNQEQIEMFAQAAIESSNSIAVLSPNYIYDIVLKLNLQAVLVADVCNNEEMAYEFAAQALLIYEENISETKCQMQLIPQLISTLQISRIFSVNNYETLASKIAVYASRLLKKPDQCRALYQAANVWWMTNNSVRIEMSPPNMNIKEKPLVRNGKKVLELLQKALRLADSGMDPLVNIRLFIEILNRYIYFYKEGNEFITRKHLDSLIELIETNIRNLEGGPEALVNRVEKDRTCVSELAAMLKSSISSLEMKQDARMTSPMQRQLNQSAAEFKQQQQQLQSELSSMSVTDEEDKEPEKPQEKNYTSQDLIIPNDATCGEAEEDSIGSLELEQQQNHAATAAMSEDLFRDLQVPNFEE